MISQCLLLLSAILCSLPLIFILLGILLGLVFFQFLIFTYNRANGSLLVLSLISLLTGIRFILSAQPVPNPVINLCLFICIYLLLLPYVRCKLSGKLLFRDLKIFNCISVLVCVLYFLVIIECMQFMKVFNSIPAMEYCLLFFVIRETVLVMREHCEHKRGLERTIIQKEKAFRKVAHELITPLYSIIGLTESVIGKKNLLSGQQAALKLILEKGFYLTGLIDSHNNTKNKKQILTDSRIVPLPFTILINDEDPVNLMIINEQLISAGYKTITVSTGGDLLKIVNSQAAQIDLIILDINLPDISGYALCLEIRKRYNRKQLPILFLATNRHANDKHKYLAIGANAYLTKPVSKGELLTQLFIYTQKGGANRC